MSIESDLAERLIISEGFKDTLYETIRAGIDITGGVTKFKEYIKRTEESGFINHIDSSVLIRLCHEIYLEEN